MDKKTKKAADVIPVTEALKNGVQQTGRSVNL